MDVVEPGYIVSSCERVVSWSRLDSVSRVIVGVVESVAEFVFLHSVDEGSVGFTVVCVTFILWNESSSPSSNILKFKYTVL